MAFRNLSDFIPEFYYFLLPEVFFSEIPPEPFSNCANCPMTAKAETDENDSLSTLFLPETKCCTYTPRLPNYHVGAILLDNSPEIREGKKRILEKIKLREGIFPNGVYPTVEYNRIYNENKQTDFGKKRNLLCPFFQEGKFNCTVWKYRESVCSFWFCKHLAGDSGYKMWQSVRNYMNLLQEILILNAARTNGAEIIDPYGESENFTDFKTLSYNNSDWYSNIWGKWEGKEEQFFIACFHWFSELSATQVKKLRLQNCELEQNLKQSILETTEIPEFLIADFSRISETSEYMYSIEISNYIKNINKSVVWNFQLPRFFIDAFDGKTTTPKILQTMKEKYELTVENEIVISLLHHRILLIVSV